jgi:hypothetical protein
MALDKKLFLAALATFGTTTACDDLGTKGCGDSGAICDHTGLTGTGETPTTPTGTTEGYGGSGTYTYSYSWTYGYSGN